LALTLAVQAVSRAEPAAQRGETFMSLIDGIGNSGGLGNIDLGNIGGNDQGASQAGQSGGANKKGAAKEGEAKFLQMIVSWYCKQLEQMKNKECELFEGQRQCDFYAGTETTGT
jgi:hypothetical protein